MKNKIFSTCFLFISLLGCLISQEAIDIRLPYLKDDKYGVVDEKGKNILPCIFEKVLVYHDFKLIGALKNNGWGIYNMDGEILLNHIINVEKGYQKGLDLEREINLSLKYITKKNQDHNLIRVNDNFAQLSYLINPEYPQNNIQPLPLKFEQNKDVRNYSEILVSKLFRVVQSDEKINFVDEKGIFLFENGFVDGFVISDSLFAISNGNTYAVRNKHKILSDTIYSEIRLLFKNGIFKGTVKNKKNSYPVYEYHLISNDGKILDKTTKDFRTYDEFSILNKNNVSILYGWNGEVLRSFSNHTLKYIYFNKKKYLINLNNNNKGLYDLEGNIVIDTIYSDLNVNSPELYICYGIDRHFTVLDTSLNSILEVDSLDGLYSTKSSEYLKYKINYYGDEKFGLIDIQGRKVIEPIWNEIEVFGCEDLVYLSNDSISYIYNYISNEKIFENEKDQKIYSFSANCRKKTINLKVKKGFLKLDFDGNEIRPKKSFKTNLKQISFKYKPLKTSTGFVLIDSLGKIVLDESFINIRYYFDELKNKEIYVCYTAKYGHPKAKVYNDQLEIITPKGYTFWDDFKNRMNQNPGVIFILNEEVQETNVFNSGMVDYDGNWLIKPFRGIFKEALQGLIVAQDFEKEHYVFYNEKGGQIASEEYDFVGVNDQINCFQNRIVVGIYKYENYKEAVKEILNSSLNISEMSKLLKELEEPDILYGYIDKKGKEIITPQFVKPVNFKNNESIIFVQKEEQSGNIVTQKIDTAGNVLVTLPFMEVSKINENNFKVKKDKYWAIADTLWDIKTPFMFDNLYERKILGTVFMGRDSLNTYFINKEYNVIKVKDKFSKAKEINEHFFFSREILERGDKRQKKDFIFNKEFEKLGSFEDVQNISDDFEGIKLPYGYLAIKLKSQKLFVYNAFTNVSYKED